ncbi:hypothetical protein L21SP3_01102 [Sedimentisphaera cyanobacteriorum]|uniref:Uncharacterized protein n=1 Tax=Sedimentisphaera cyanobacteriorum TaxID=1940790 RepID=A0A1Q2HPB8_9BACT|nr:hypothetical protein [Sedimentisphaera cyanobacteriorum]AQQ09299.1 hypothetical protein L21SP3_01102 [Sedimentisphaera cyanobacteriorum]
MNTYILKLSALAFLILAAGFFCFAENIDPYQDGSQYAWSVNAGWLNFQPAQGSGVQVSSDSVQGFVWAENIGWINLSPSNYGGVINDGSGNLSGFAWAENAGWINFAPNGGGVTIDSDGEFSGWAWGENIGWVNFAVSDAVQACRVSLEDLYSFADDWLKQMKCPGDLNQDFNVDMLDSAVLANYWMDYCPDAWPLK